MGHCKSCKSQGVYIYSSSKYLLRVMHRICKRREEKVKLCLGVKELRLCRRSWQRIGGCNADHECSIKSRKTPAVFRYDDKNVFEVEMSLTCCSRQKVFLKDKLSNNVELCLLRKSQKLKNNINSSSEKRFRQIAYRAVKKMKTINEDTNLTVVALCRCLVGLCASNTSRTHFKKLKAYLSNRVSKNMPTEYKFDELIAEITPEIYKLYYKNETIDTAAESIAAVKDVSETKLIKLQLILNILEDKNLKLDEDNKFSGLMLVHYFDASKRSKRKACVNDFINGLNVNRYPSRDDLLFLSHIPLKDVFNSFSCSIRKELEQEQIFEKHMLKNRQIYRNQFVAVQSDETRSFKLVAVGRKKNAF